MSNALIAFLAAIGASAWVFSKMQRQTGGNTSNSLIVAGGSGMVLFLIVITLLAMFAPK